MKQIAQNYEEAFLRAVFYAAIEMNIPHVRRRREEILRCYDDNRDIICGLQFTPRIKWLGNVYVTTRSDLLTRHDFSHVWNSDLAAAAEYIVAYARFQGSILPYARESRS